MPERANQPQSLDDHEGRVVAKAVVNAGRALGLTQDEIGTIIGVSSGQVSKLKGGQAVLQGKPFELALYLIRIFRSLDAVTGGDTTTNRAWMRNRNTDLNGYPADLMRSAAGLVNVMSYLDASRAPI